MENPFFPLRKKLAIHNVVVLAAALQGAWSQSADTLPAAEALKQMSLEDLMNIKVTSVSKHAEKLSAAPSAIQVITAEDIRRSGAVTLPQALRLASNLEVAQIDSRTWAISARGFNSNAANKLLVLIDGRTVYTPLYSGVFWDAQYVPLADVDRIEVISGPGGTLWGSNAVNGVINIITKKAKDTQGFALEGGGGNFERDFGQTQFGGRLGPNAQYRVYGQRIDQDGTLLPNGKDGANGIGVTQGGFRMDWGRSEADNLTAQGDLYDGSIDQPGSGFVDLNGQNVIGRWVRKFSPRADMQLQVYFDHTWRKAALDSASAFTEDLKTYDIDFHHRFELLPGQNLMWGAGYRLMQDDVTNFAYFSFLPGRKDLHIFNVFVQDEISLVPDRLKATLGSKLEHEDYDGFNLQPSTRLAWTLNARQMVWGAVSRAVRTPSRIDVDYYAPTPPVPASVPRLAGGPEFQAEKLLAYELGYRAQPLPSLSFSASAYYNRYHDLRTWELTALSPPTIQFKNGLEGNSRGIELSGEFQATSWWRLRAGYNFLKTHFWANPGVTDFANPLGEANDPSHQASLQSMMDLPAGFQLNGDGYYVASLPNPHVPARFTYDAGLAWTHDHLEASVYGYNLGNDEDPQFQLGTTVGQRIPRSFAGKLAYRF